MPEPVQPTPKRYYWLKRLGFGSAVLLLLVVGLRLWWGHRADSRLVTTITGIESRGEPIRFEDMRHAPPPDHDNKAYHLRRAIAQWPAVPGRGDVITQTDWYGNPENYPDPITDNIAYLEQVRAVLPLLEQADAASGCDWGVVLQSPAINILLPNLSEARGLARLVVDALERSTETGDIELTLRLLDSLRVIAESVETDPYVLISHLVNISIRAMACHAVETQLPLLELPADPEHPARVRLNSVMQQWLDEQHLHGVHQKAWIGERWFFYDIADTILDGRTSLTSLGLGTNSPRLNKSFLQPIRPLLVHDTNLGVEYLSIFVNISTRSPDYPAFARNLNEQLHEHFGMIPMEDLEWNYRIHPITSLLLPATGAASRVHYRLMALRRMAATAIAIRLYETDHGTRPDTLDRLVPDYLAAVPIDPFAKDGVPLRYRLHDSLLVGETKQHLGQGLYSETASELKARGPAVVYSVGFNAVDDGGTVLVDKDGAIRQSTTDEDLNIDFCFLLDTPEDAYPTEPAGEDGIEP